MAMASLVGCTTTEEGGRSGTDTFTVSVPGLSTTVKQGETEVARVTVNRGQGFKQSLKLEMKATAGLQVTPGNVTLKLGDKGDVQLTITAAADAPLGEHKVAVKATPDTGGEPASAEFMVKVVAP